MVYALEKDEREVGAIHEEVRRRWLAGTALPISAVFELGSLEGSLPLRLPLFASSYHVVKSAKAFIKVFIAVEPAILPSRPIEAPWQANGESVEVKCRIAGSFSSR